MKVQIDGTQAMALYSAAFKRLRMLPGFDMKHILKAEAGSILKQWAGKTKVTTPKRADERARYRAGKTAFGSLKGADSNTYGISVNTGVRGAIPGWVWFKHRAENVMLAGYIDDTGQIHTNPERRFRTDKWARIIAGMEAYADSLMRYLPHAKDSVGFSRQAVVQIADQLGIDLAAVAGTGVSAAGVLKARKAIAANGRSYQNGVGTMGGDETRFFIKGTCRLPYAQKSGMDRELAGVIARRAKYIETSFQKGALDSARRAARAFPNVFKVAA